MDDATAGLLRFLAVSSVHVAVLVLAGAIVLKALRPRSRTIAAILTLLAVVPVLSGLSEFLPVKTIPVLPPIEIVTPAGEPAASEPAPLPAPGGGAGDPAALPTFAPAAGSLPATSPERNETNWWGLLAIAWLGGVGIFGARIGLRFLALARILRASRSVSDPAAIGVLREACARIGLARVPSLAASGSVAVPFVTGVLRPNVVLPERLLEPSASAALRFSLLHETAHLKRGDHFTILPELVLRTIYFFHPLVHWVFARIREEREHLCDVIVTRAAGRRAPYADFLLNEVEWTRCDRREVPVLALRQGRGAVFRRVHRLLAERRKSMRDGIRGAFALALVAVLTATILALGPAPVVPPVAAGESEQDLKSYDRINASPGEKDGTFHVMPVFTELVAVRVIKRGGPYGKEHTRELTPDDYEFTLNSGWLHAKVPVDRKKEMVIVYGTRKVPWQWKATEVLKKDSVRMLLDDRAGVRGEDFEADESRGVIRFLKKELCRKELNYYITYSYPEDPEKPSTGRGGAIGNHPDRVAVRKWLGIPDVPATPEQRKTSVGTNASATDDPRNWTLVRAMESKGVKVAIATKGKPGNLNWLVRGKDYTYDQESCVITFLRDMPVDEETQFVFVSGVPADPGTMHLHRTLEPGKVKVIVGTRRLVEGEDFTVDYERGIVRVKGNEIRKPGVKFYLSHGSGAFGNYDDRALLKKLLED